MTTTTTTPEARAEHEARQALKIQPVDFRVTWTESPQQDVTERVATTWADFAGILGRLKVSAPHGGAYHKTGFMIRFADGFEYTGRYDVENISRRQESISQHVAAHVGYVSGLVRPSHISEEDYAGHLSVIGEPAQAFMYFIARDYAVGVDTPEDREPEAAADPAPAFVDLSHEDQDGPSWYPTDEARRRVGAGALNPTEPSAPYAVVETKPPGTPGEVRRLVVAEWPTLEAANADTATWREANPTLRYHVQDPHGERAEVEAEAEADPFAGVPSATIAEALRTFEPEEQRAAVFTEEGRQELARRAHEIHADQDPLLFADLLAFFQSVEEASPGEPVALEAFDLHARVMAESRRARR